VNHDDTEIVSAFRARLAEQMGRQRFELWFGATRFALAGSRLLVHVGSDFQQGWLRANFLRDIHAACLAIGQDAAVEFIVDPQLAEAAAPAPVPANAQIPMLRVANPADSEHDGRGSTSAVCAPKANGGIEPKTATATTTFTRRSFRSLGTFVVGDSNRLAHTSVRMLLDRPGTASPLFLYGPTGVGKTHLLEGLWSEARKSGRHVTYMSSEQFTTLFVDAVRGGGMPNFRSKYRGVDVLLIDDVQFLCGKTKTAGELLHTIDTLQRDGRQVALAADRAPGDLPGLGTELQTRLHGGMTCRLDIPDFATRLGIVQQLAVRMSLQVPPPVAEFVAAQFTCNGRELAGALNRLHATSLAADQPITLTLAERALADLVQQSQRAVRLRDVERVVCEVFGLEDESLRATSKAKGVNEPRMFAMCLARRHTRAALSEISRYFGRRSHSSVVTAQKKIDDLVIRGGSVDLADRACSAEEAIRRIEDRLRAG
jgi:chromosomal replication initiator protein